MKIAGKSNPYLAVHNNHFNYFTKKIVARTISRSTPMDHKFQLRCKEADKAAIKIAAQAQGLDCSTFIRWILIKERVLTPDGTQQDSVNF